LRDHFRRIASDLDVTFIVQDHPASSGVNMSAEFIASLADVLPVGSVVKLEDPPTPSKIARLVKLAPSFQIIGGLGGVSLLHELEAGSIGTMTGFALPHILVDIVRAYRRGDTSVAARIYEQALPLMIFEAQPGAGPALRKEILKRRGAIAHSTVRQPATPPDAITLRLLDELLASTTAGAPI
jgi:4-hydroxy-tetrahydrodipicolinate synthase